jgi:predicted metal-binding membrane protein
VSASPHPAAATQPYYRPELPRRFRVPAAVIAFALAGWFASAMAMRGMSMKAAPSVGWFVSLWVAMSAAMMLPTVVPAASLATTLGRSAVSFVGGYFLLWAGSGLAAFAVARLVAGGRGWAVGALVAAALYQLSPFKHACLRRCRSPLGSLLRRGAFAAGLEHGVVCLGCCWALMLALLALGIGSMLWMAAFAAAIFVEKVTTVGAHAWGPVALALLAAAFVTGL